MEQRVMMGRRVIYTDVADITEKNILDVLQKAFFIHMMNKADIEYLYAYYRGNQPILRRKKDVRPEIKNEIVENRANEIVSFKVGYLMGEPVQYVSKSDSLEITSRIDKLNEYIAYEDKAAKDKELADWFHIAGTAYRMVLPDSTVSSEEDAAPFEIYTLDPRYTFVVRLNTLGTPVVMAVKYVIREDGTQIFSCYTRDRYFEIVNMTDIVRSEYQVLGIPIVEYPANNARLGAFEIVLPLLDAINNVDSNRMDGVEQFIQAIMLFHNVIISDEDYDKLRSDGAIKYKDVDPQLKGEIKYLTEELNQTQTQTLVDHMYNTVLTICGMPNRNGGSSTSDTGSAVIMRDGWSAAEARAKDSELMFKKSEKEFLKLVLRICHDLSDLELNLSAVEIRFTRRNYENITEKANVLTAMLSNSKIHPMLAFTHSGMFTDPLVAYKMSEEYSREQQKKAQEIFNQTGGDQGNGQATNQNSTGGGPDDNRNPEPGEKR